VPGQLGSPPNWQDCGEPLALEETAAGNQMMFKVPSSTCHSMGIGAGAACCGNARVLERAA